MDVISTIKHALFSTMQYKSKIKPRDCAGSLRLCERKLNIIWRRKLPNDFWTA